MHVRKREIISSFAFSFTLILGCADRDAPMSWKDIASTTAAIKQGTAVTNPAGFERSVVRVNSTIGGCTGTLVKPPNVQGGASPWVITARHCVVDNNTGLIAGSTNISDFNNTLLGTATSNNTFTHPDPNVDAALLLLPQSFTLGATPPYISPAQDPDIVGQSTNTYGYGEFSENGGNPGNLLRTATLPISNIVRNEDMNGNGVYAGRYLLIQPNSAGQTILSGDSGGPSFLNGSILALTGGPFFPYARSFRDWANSVMLPRNSGSLADPSDAHFWHGALPAVPMTGDFNGDGRDDLIQFYRNSASQVGDVYVHLALTTSTGYANATLWHDLFAVDSQVPNVGDFDGDGKQDIVAFDQTNGQVQVALSNGSHFGSAEVWHTAFAWANDRPMVGDFNGDGRDDIITFVQWMNWGDVYVSFSCGTNPSPAGGFPPGCNAAHTFGSRIFWISPFSLDTDIPRTGDVNGDGLDDLITFTSNKEVYVSLTHRRPCTSDSQCSDRSFPKCYTGLGICPGTEGEGAGPKTLWATNFSAVQSGHIPMVGDMNGDGKADIINFENTNSVVGRNGLVGVQLSNGSQFPNPYFTWNRNFCAQGLICALGDVNGDGRRDGVTFALSPSPNNKVRIGLSQ